MMKSTIFAMLGLAAVLTVASPPKANAGVFIGIGVAPRPAYGYVVVHPRPYAYYAPPYYAPPYGYRPGFAPGYGFYGRFGADPRFGRRDWDRRDRYDHDRYDHYCRGGWRSGYRR